METFKHPVIKQNKGRIIIWSAIAALILALLIAMQFAQFNKEVQWNETIAYIFILLAVGGGYEIVMELKKHSTIYRLAFGVGFAGALFLGWANGAVGIIGSENQSVNSLYGIVFAIGLIGSLISRFKPRGMAHTLFVAAIVQMLIPIAVLFFWPVELSWGAAGINGVLFLNFIFVVLFAVSGFLFLRASKKSNHSQDYDEFQNHKIIDRNQTPATKSNKRLFSILLGATFLLLAPLVLQLTIGTGVDGQGFNWKLSDFVIMGFLLFGTGVSCELVMRKERNIKDRVLICGGILLTFLLIWADLAVGIFNIPGFSGS